MYYILYYVYNKWLTVGLRLISWWDMYLKNAHYLKHTCFTSSHILEERIKMERTEMSIVSISNMQDVLVAFIIWLYLPITLCPCITELLQILWARINWYFNWIIFNFICWHNAALGQHGIYGALRLKVIPIWRSGGLGFPTWGDPCRPGLGLEQCDWQVRLTSSVEVGPWRLITITQHRTDGMKASLTTPLMGHHNISRVSFSLSILCFFPTLAF